MSWERVQDWLELLRATDVGDLNTGLSPQGNRAAWSAALDALSPEVLVQVSAVPGTPYDTAAFVAAATVFTAPLEWLAVLLGRGATVGLKPPSAAPDAAELLARSAARVGLPLSVVDRDHALQHELIVAMGGDDTMAALRATVPATSRLLDHGHRFSVAWLTELASVDALADDVALYDTRGCFSPQLVLTPISGPVVAEAIADALCRAGERLPVGEIAPSEAARLRARGALARVLGRELRGEGYSVHLLPADRLRPDGLPRSVALAQVADFAAAQQVLAPWVGTISTFGTDDASAAFPADRTAALGQMQRPPVLRVHDGRDWLRATLRP